MINKNHLAGMHQEVEEQNEQFFHDFSNLHWMEWDKRAREIFKEMNVPVEVYGDYLANC